MVQRTAKKCTKVYSARAQLLFSSLNLLFGAVIVACVVVVCLSSLFVCSKRSLSEQTSVFRAEELSGTGREKFYTDDVITCNWWLLSGLQILKKRLSSNGHPNRSPRDRESTLPVEHQYIEDFVTPSTALRATKPDPSEKR